MTKPLMTARARQTALMIVLAVFTYNNAAGAQTGGGHCAAREKLLAVLATQYGETKRGMGLAANNTLMEVFASDATGTWTIAVTMPSGVTCLVASGSGYEDVVELLPVPGEPT